MPSRQLIAAAERCPPPPVAVAVSCPCRWILTLPLVSGAGTETETGTGSPTTRPTKTFNVQRLTFPPTAHTMGGRKARIDTGGAK